MSHESMLPNMGEKEDKYFNVLLYRQSVKKEDPVVALSPGCWVLDTILKLVLLQTP